MNIILSLFPGADLFGKAFEDQGFCVVRGPELILGQDIRDFHVPEGKFDGIIGGPPCQSFSIAKHFQNNPTHGNLIPEFLRIVDEAKPKWAIMENVLGALSEFSEWPHVKLCDWDCGGLTKRKRIFWFYGINPPTTPLKRDNFSEAAYSVLATSWKDRRGKSKKWQEKTKAYPQRNAEEAALLQGFPEIAQTVINALPYGMTPRQKNIYTVHLLGNGVPNAMGTYLAKHVAKSQDSIK